MRDKECSSGVDKEGLTGKAVSSGLAGREEPRDRHPMVFAACRRKLF